MLTPREYRQVIDGCNALAGTPFVETLEFRVATALRNAAKVIRTANTDDSPEMEAVREECLALARKLVPLTGEDS